MISTSLQAIAGVLTGARMQNMPGDDTRFVGVSTDSRRVASGSLFVALRGERFDAHDFLSQLADSGAAAVLVERLPEGWTLPAIVVPDTRIALGELAHFWRTQFSLPLIAVTGSNGKTTVKGMIASILRAAFGEADMLATQGNFNNDIGVPITLFGLDARHRAAVVEMGTNHPGEIAYLAAIVQPTVALVNNAQREHQEFLHGVEAVAVENGAAIRALPRDGVVVFPADDVYTGHWQNDAGTRSVMRFGLRPDAEVWCTWQSLDFGSELQIYPDHATRGVKLHAAGEHNVRNALAATAAALATGIEWNAIVAGLEAFEPVAGRLQRKLVTEGEWRGASVIDDTYNANPDSVRAAIDVLAAAPSPRLMVLGDMGEVGEQGEAFHREIGAYCAQRGINALLTLGQSSRYATDAFGPVAVHFAQFDALPGALAHAMTPDTTVLVKGSRFMKMERVVAFLLHEGIKEVH